MKKSKIALLTLVLVMNLVLASCALGRNLRNAATNNPPVSNPVPTVIPTLIVAPTSVPSSQASEAVPTVQPIAQSATSVQSQPVSNDDLDAITQDMQQISEPDVSVDSISTMPPTDNLLDLDGLNQDTQDMQQVLNGLK